MVTYQRRIFRANILAFLLFNVVAVICLPSVKAQAFNSSVAVAVSQQTYTYTVFNNEPLGSSLYNTNFTLFLPNATPFIVTGTPDGWAYSSDNQTSVFWYNTDPSLPYPHDIAPGTFLSGFSIQATVPSSPLNVNFETDAWDHSIDYPGPALTGTVLGPQATASVPEASPKALLGLGLMTFGFSGLGLKAWKRARKQV